MEAKQKTDILQGTLAPLVLKTLDVLGLLHGYGIARRIESDQRRFAFSQPRHSLSTAVEAGAGGSIASEWGAQGNNRRARFYHLTIAGRKQLHAETRDWNQTAAIIARFFAVKAEDF